MNVGVRTLIAELICHLLLYGSLQRQVFVNDIVDQLGRFELGCEHDVIVEVCEGVAFAFYVALQTSTLAFDWE
jgi:hypothetical protein